MTVPVKKSYVGCVFAILLAANCKASAIEQKVIHRTPLLLALELSGALRDLAPLGLGRLEGDALSSKM